MSLWVTSSAGRVKLSKILQNNQKKIVRWLLKKKERVCDLGCAPKSFGTQTFSTYLARRLATAGLQFAAVMMTRTRIIQRCMWLKFTLFPLHI
jgi:hypothetical protein